MTTIELYQYVPLHILKVLVFKGQIEEEPSQEDVRRLASFLDNLVEWPFQHSVKNLDYHLLTYLLGSQGSVIPQRYVALCRLYELLQTDEKAFGPDVPNATERIKSILSNKWKSTLLCKLLCYIQGEGFKGSFQSWTPLEKERWSLLW